MILSLQSDPTSLARDGGEPRRLQRGAVPRGPPRRRPGGQVRAGRQGRLRQVQRGRMNERESFAYFMIGLV